MKLARIITVLAILIIQGDGFLNSKKKQNTGKGDYRNFATVKIYSNLAEIIQPLGKLPLEFSSDDWSDIRADSVTLVGANVTVTEQTITEKRKSLNNAQIFVRTPSSTTSHSKFLPATLVDEQRNLVKILDKDIAKESLFFFAPADQIVYIDEPAQPKYYVNFTYDTSDAVYLSYLRSSLNWKTRYQMNLFDDAKSPVLIAMADIRNDGKSRVDIEYAELLGGDINLQMYEQTRKHKFGAEGYSGKYQSMAMNMAPASASGPVIDEGEEIAGLYIFNVEETFSIEAKTNHLLPMFRPHITVDRYCSISKGFSGAGSSSGKADRSYRLSSDRFLTHGNCIIRESDRLVGETSLPDVAAKNKHEFSIGQDAEVIYKQNVTLLSSFTSNSTSSTYYRIQTQTRSTYDVTLLLKSFKAKRLVDVEFTEQLYGTSVKLLKSDVGVTLEGLKIKYRTKLAANGEKMLSYKVEIVS